MIEKSTDTTGDVERPFLSRLSIAMFSLVMGIGGLANAWAAAYSAFGVPVEISQVLLAVACAIFVVLVIAHSMKLGLHFSAVVEEFNHPVRASFFPATSVAAIVLSIGLKPYAYNLAHWLWIVGAAAHFVFAITLIRRWITKNQDEAILTPAWFIPVVGNILVPVGGVQFGHFEVSFFFFSIGLVLWLVFFSIVMHRILFFAPMSERSVPTLFILLAPPSIGLSAYFGFTGGNAGALAYILYSLALFIAILLITLARHLVHGAFFISWWAMTFPADGWAGATILFYRAHPTLTTEVVAICALGLATLIVAMVGFGTVRHMLSGRAFRED